MNNNPFTYSFKSRSGRQINIRPVIMEDLKILTDYVNTIIEEDTFVMVSGDKMSLEEEKKYLVDVLDKVAKKEKVHLLAFDKDILIGSFEIRKMKKRSSHVGEIGISMLEKYRDDGIGSNCLKILIDKARSMDLKLLCLHVFASNDRAIHVYEKLGFVKAGIIPKMYLWRGEFIGQITMYKLI